MSDEADKIRASTLPGGGHLFVAAGGGGDVLAASIVQRMLYDGDTLPYVVTYSWDRLMVDPLPGPRGPTWFEDIESVGDRNFVVSARSSVRSPGQSLLPRLAKELSTGFYLLDPYGGASGMRAQLAELVSLLEIERVSLVDSGGDILAAGDEAELRSPLVDSLALAAADSVGAPVDVIVTGAGLDGELKPKYVRDVITKLGGDLDWHQLDVADVDWVRPALCWHPSEVNGLLILAAMGFTGTVEIRDAGLRVQVDRSSAAVHRCSYDAAIAHNLLAKSLIESKSLYDAERAIAVTEHRSEMDYQRKNAKRYDGGPRSSAEIEQCVARLNYHTATMCDGVDALTLRRAAEVMSIRQDELEALGPLLREKFPQHFVPPLWTLT